MKKGYVIIFICILFLLAACSNDDAGDNKEDSKQESTGENTVDSNQKENVDSNLNLDIPEAARTIEDTLKQEQGIMVEDLLAKKEEMDEEAFSTYYKETFTPKIEAKIKGYMKEHPDIGADELYDYLIYLLGSSYDDAVQEIEDFKPAFSEPDLPTGPDTTTSDDGETVEKEQNAILLLDASGSMNAVIDGKTQMEIAKQALKEFAGDLDEDTNVSLLVYGHVGTGSDEDKEKSCTTIDIKYDLGQYEKTKFKDAFSWGTFKS